MVASIPASCFPPVPIANGIRYCGSSRGTKHATFAAVDVVSSSSPGFIEGVATDGARQFRPWWIQVSVLE